MSEERRVEIFEQVCTAIGAYDRSFKGFAATDLGSLAIRRSINRSGIAPEGISPAEKGNVTGLVIA